MSPSPRYRRLAALAAVGLALPVGLGLGFEPATALATGKDLRLQIEPLLRSVERVPDRARLELSTDGDEVDKALREIIDDEAVPALSRVQALTALGDYDDPSGQATLRRLVEDRVTATAGTPVLELRAAVLSYARVAGTGSAGTLRLVIGHAVPDVRADAARAARQAKVRELVPDLRERLVRESVGFVRAELTDAIRELSL